jgi:hypothetical protein
MLLKFTFMNLHGQRPKPVSCYFPPTAQEVHIHILSLISTFYLWLMLESSTNQGILLCLHAYRGALDILCASLLLNDGTKFQIQKLDIWLKQLAWLLWILEKHGRKILEKHWSFNKGASGIQVPPASIPQILLWWPWAVQWHFLTLTREAIKLSDWREVFA